MQQVLGDVDQLLARLKRRLPADAAPLQRLRALNQFFFHDLSFGGNVNDYYDPDNSYLNAVLRTRRGIPISLAVLWMELAQGLGLQARGVGFPGHFMLKVTLPKGQVVIDPFTGQSLSREELSERLEPYKRSNGLVGEFDVPLGLYLQPATPREIIGAHAAQPEGNPPRAGRLAARDRGAGPPGRRCCPRPGASTATAAWRMPEQGNTALAVRDLETYLAHAEDALDIDAIAERVRRAAPRRED